MILLRELETIQTTSNSEFNLLSFLEVKYSEHLIQLIIMNAQFIESNNIRFLFQNLNISNKEKLSNINLNGSQGIDWINSKIDLSKSSKLNNIDLQNCGLNENEINILISNLADNADAGMGQGIITSKTIKLQGINAKPTNIEGIGRLKSKGYTVTTN